uniref:Polypeptide N-acetylgalactosaminyltransferase 9 n=1 Tax=Panthera leo TaxID=9689 RepID=A0A8C8Y5Y6_PANLE
MAVARKIKTLLTVNILVFVGIIVFSVYCRLQDRSEGLVQTVRSADRRVRGRHAKAGALADREAILERLDHLEEVVYNQLNGLAKPIGLVEGPGGLGQGGMAATLREDSQETESKYEEYGYNAQLSDRISLDRTIPDYRPKKCRQMTHTADLPQISVVFIFVNEALSVILRSVHSVVPVGASWWPLLCAAEGTLGGCLQSPPRAGWGGKDRLSSLGGPVGSVMRGTGVFGAQAWGVAPAQPPAAAPLLFSQRP